MLFPDTTDVSEIYSTPPKNPPTSALLDSGSGMYFSGLGYTNITLLFSIFNQVCVNQHTKT